MLNCWACPFYPDCKVETEVQTAGEGKQAGGKITTPVAEKECPLKRAVEVVNKQIDRINSLGIV